MSDLIHELSAIALRFHENPYDGISLARQLLIPQGYKQKSFMRDVDGQVIRVAVFQKTVDWAVFWIALNYSDGKSEVIAFGDQKSYQTYLSKIPL